MENPNVISREGVFHSGNIKEQQTKMNVQGATGNTSPIRNIILLIVYIGLLFYCVTLFV
jgi:hypothetical protein